MNIFVIVGASGSGKTTIARKVEFLEKWTECKSHTTRSMRHGEVNGKDYYFVDEKMFAEMLRNGEFAEHVEYDGNHYGISKEEINSIGDQGKDCFIIANYDGYQQIKKIYPNLKSIFIYALLEECIQRMVFRGDSKDSIRSRMEKYYKEVSVKDEFELVVHNQDFNLAVEEVLRFIESSKKENVDVLL